MSQFINSPTKLENTATKVRASLNFPRHFPANIVEEFMNCLRLYIPQEV